MPFCSSHKVNILLMNNIFDLKKKRKSHYCNLVNVMQYLSPSYEMDLDSPYSFVQSKRSVYRDGLPLHAPRWWNCIFCYIPPTFFVRYEKEKILNYSVQVYWKMSSCYWWKNAGAWKGGCIFLSQSSCGSFRHTINIELYVPDCFSQNCKPLQKSV